MIGVALLGIALAATTQIGPVASPDRNQADAARDAEMEAAIDAAMPSDGEPLPAADRQLYTGRDVCSVLKKAYPVLGLSGWDGQPRTGEWRSIPFVQNGLQISGHWGSCVQKWRQFFPEIHELLITVDGRQALVSGGKIQGGECRFVKVRGSWKKVICFNTWIE